MKNVFHSSALEENLLLYNKADKFTCIKYVIKRILYMWTCLFCYLSLKRKVLTLIFCLKKVIYEEIII
jgi:hypothetical protein